MSTSYESDVVAWANEQAELIRTRQFDKLDLSHIAEELQDVGKSEQRELAHRVAVLFMHLLKWEYQPSHRGNSWSLTIKEQRRAIDRCLKRTPSLKRCLSDSDWLEDVWLDARGDAHKETGCGFDRFPEACPWDLSLALQDDWLPGEDGTEQTVASDQPT